jgi:hypothetical protein
VTASIAGRTRAAIETTPDRSGHVDRLYTVVEDNAEAGRFVTFAHSRLARDTVAAVRRMATRCSRTCQPARPASATTLLSAGSSPAQNLAHRSMTRRSSTRVTRL